ncbi:hypothetical protein NUK31_22010, partial [Aeromonas caviae]|uniref:hypothetical protein n=2 Tax=Aeromonas TaxID=642 RepID=UPI00214EF51E
LMMSLWDALRMNMMISYQELVRTFLNLADGPALETRLISSGSIGRAPTVRKSGTCDGFRIFLRLVSDLNDVIATSDEPLAWLKVFTEHILGKLISASAALFPKTKRCFLSQRTSSRTEFTPSVI